MFVNEDGEIEMFEGEIDENDLNAVLTGKKLTTQIDITGVITTYKKTDGYTDEKGVYHPPEVIEDKKAAAAIGGGSQPNSPGKRGTPMLKNNIFYKLGDPKAVVASFRPEPDKKELKNRDAIFGEIYAHDFSTIDSSLYYKIAITNPYKLIVPDKKNKSSEEVMLFNLEKDPYEKTNLAKQKPEIVESLNQKLDAFRSDGSVK